MWSLFEGTAWAQGVAAGAQGSEYGTLIQMAPIVGIIAIFYFLIIRPQTPEGLRAYEDARRAEEK